MSFSNYRYNRIGGIDADKTLESGEIVPYTLSEDEIKDIPKDEVVTDYVAPNTAVDDFKRERQSMLDNAVVTISSGKSFDADELSINRMVNAILAAIDEPGTFIIKWSTADTGTGELVDCTLLELKEAHKLAMQNMSSIWSIEG